MRVDRRSVSPHLEKVSKDLAADRNGTAYKRILLILEAVQMGDTLRIVPYITAVREHHPHAHITLVANEDALGALPHINIFDRVIISRLFYHRPYSRFGAQFSKVRQLLHIFRQLGRGHDLVLTYWCGSPLLQVLGYAVSHGERVGFAYPGMPAWLLSSRLGLFDRYGSAAEQHVVLLEAAGIHTTIAGPPEIRWTEDDLATVMRMLEEHGLASATKLVVLHPGSDWACQQWLQERWAHLADELVRRYHTAVVFTGSSTERDYVSATQRRMKTASVSLVGKTSLGQLACLLTRSWLCVCVDSAVFELTQATGTPAVVLAGPTRPEMVAPGQHVPIVVNRNEPQMVAAIRSCQEKQSRRNVQLPNRAPTSMGCLNYQCHMACLRAITVDDVLGAVDCQVQKAGLCGNGASLRAIEKSHAGRRKVYPQSWHGYLSRC